MERRQRIAQTEAQVRWTSLTRALAVVALAMVTLFMHGCRMSQEPRRMHVLLDEAGIPYAPDPAIKPLSLPDALDIWKYTTSEGKVRLWVYRFKDQEHLDRAMDVAEQAGRQGPGRIDFAQNGQLLLVTWFEKEASREISSRFLQAFAGEE